MGGVSVPNSEQTDGWVQYLVLPADVRRVCHVVAPVLRPDLVLLFGQELQLLVTRLHVLVQAAQVVLTPLGVFLSREEHQCERKPGQPARSVRKKQRCALTQTQGER